MSAAADKAKGNAKEAVGKATNDDEKVAEGKADQTKGDIKSKIEDVKDNIKKALD
ncbi:MAG: CsbD family protein [Microbacterium gubbeenense]